MQIEIAVIGRQFHDLLQLHQFFAYAPVRDQTLDRANAQPMFLAELHQLRQPRHRSVVVQDFAKHSRRLQSGHSREIDGRFGVTCASQHAAILGPQRKHMTRLIEIVRRRFRVRDRQDGRRAIVRADPGRHSARRIDRNSEIGPMRFAVLRHHSLQAELLGALVRDRHANQAASVRRHEIDRFRRHFFRCHDQIAFVLAIGIVGHDHHAPFGDVAHHIVNRIELKCLCGLCNHRNNTITSRAALSNSH